MENTEWQRRAKDAGLRQKTLAKLLGMTELSVSVAIRGRLEIGVPIYIMSTVIAWEMMAPDQRSAWEAAVDDLPLPPRRPSRRGRQLAQELD